MFFPKTEANTYLFDDVQMLEASNKVLTSAWSEVIRGMLQNRITRSVMFDIQVRTDELFASMKDTLTVKSDDILEYFQDFREQSRQHEPSPDLSTRLKVYNNQMMKSRGPRVRSKADVKIIAKHLKRNIIILDVNKEPILTISFHDILDSIELIYNPPCPAHPGGYFDAYVNGRVIKTTRYDKDDYDRLCSAICVALAGTCRTWLLQIKVKKYIDEHPSDAGMLLTSDGYAYQLKRGRALLRLNMNRPTRHMNQCEYVELDSWHLFGCIEQALKSENLSQLAKKYLLAKYESKLISGHETELMTSLVSSVACQLFLSSESSIETEVYRQLVVERIIDGDITTALKLCCIGHQIPFGRDKININLPISDVQTLRDTFERMLEMESYEEISKFQSICDEWCRVLEPQGLMNIEQRELLRKWISTRQYANTEDPIVSDVIEKCLSINKTKDKEKKRTNAAELTARFDIHWPTCVGGNLFKGENYSLKDFLNSVDCM